MKHAGDRLGTLLPARPVINLDVDFKGVYIATKTKCYQKCVTQHFFKYISS
jgi:hypothetical protein